MFTNLFKRLIFTGLYFSPDPGSGGGGETEEQKTAREAKEAADAAAVAAQEKQNAQYAERAERAAEATRKKLWADLGVKDEAEYQAFLKKKKDDEDSQKTAADKLADDLKKEQDRAQSIEDKAKVEKATLEKRILDTEIKIAALAQVVDEKDGKVLRPSFRADAIDDVLLVIKRDAITEKDGKYEGIEKALDDLAKAKPFYLNGETKKEKETAKGTPSEKAKKKKVSTSEDDDEEKPMFNQL